MLRMIVNIDASYCDTVKHAGQGCSSDGQLRLYQTASVNRSNAGRVEICLGGVWGTVAVDSVATPWSEKNAQVACIQLGFTGALNGILPNTYKLFVIIEFRVFVCNK